jgi:hypothetical protein
MKITDERQRNLVAKLGMDPNREYSTIDDLSDLKFRISSYKERLRTGNATDSDEYAEVCMTLLQRIWDMPISGISSKSRRFISELGYDPEADYQKDEELHVDLYLAAEHMLITRGFDRDYVINEKGFACEEIMDWLADMELSEE